MGLLSKLSGLFLSIADSYPSDPKPLSDAQCDEITFKREADKAAEMELRMENETDPLIRKKLEWMLYVPNLA